MSDDVPRGSSARVRRRPLEAPGSASDPATGQDAGLPPRALTGAQPRALAGGEPGLNRRTAVRWAGSGLAFAVLAACSKAAPLPTGPTPIPERDDGATLSSKEARARLEDGNLRFVQGLSQHTDQSLVRRKKLADGQAPFAALLTCADARVPPELVFDQGLGDLYVVSSAGPTVDKTVLGTLQYSVTALAVPLLVVLGHTGCDVMAAAAAALDKKAPSGSDLDAVLDELKPAVMDAKRSGADTDTLVAAAVANNVDAVVTQLKAVKAIDGAVKAGKLRIVGAIYELETGEVTFS